MAALRDDMRLLACRGKSKHLVGSASGAKTERTLKSKRERLEADWASRVVVLVCVDDCKKPSTSS